MALVEIGFRAPKGCSVRETAAGPRLLAARAFAAGEPVLRLAHPRWGPFTDDFTVKDRSGVRLYDPVLPLIAHADCPNTRLSLELLVLIARQDILPGEPLTRDYRLADQCRRGALT
jgi:hypothetical protein